MAQSADKKEGVSFWVSRTPDPPTFRKKRIVKFHWGIIAKYDNNPDDFYFDTTLTAAQVAAFPPEVNRKKRTESVKT